MHRRAVLRAAASVGALSFGPAVARGSSDPSVHINLYWTEKLDTAEGNDAAIGAKRILDSVIGAANGYNPDVTVMHTVPVEDTDDADAMHDSFETYLYDHPDERAVDSNVLLTCGWADPSGTSEIDTCESCDPQFGDSAVVEGCEHLAGTSSVPAFDRPGLLTNNPPMVTLVHEVGHNLGLTHDDGESVDVSSDHFGVDGGETVVSPMIGPYALSDNSVGPNLSNDECVYSVTYFSSEREMFHVEDE